MQFVPLMQATIRAQATSNNLADRIVFGLTAHVAERAVGITFDSWQHRKETCLPPDRLRQLWRLDKRNHGNAP